MNPTHCAHVAAYYDELAYNARHGERSFYERLWTLSWRYRRWSRADYGHPSYPS